jgi:hypothetical protein
VERHTLHSAVLYLSAVFLLLQQRHGFVPEYLSKQPMYFVYEVRYECIPYVSGDVKNFAGYKLV